jgi:hypothetical protein
MDVRLGVAAAKTDETIDREVLNLEVPDLGAPVALSTPRVYAARTANEFRAAASDAAAVPTARREFLRTERLLIRFDAYGVGGDEMTAAVVNWTGERLAAVSIAAAEAGGTHQISLSLGSLAPGEYAVEINAKGPGGQARELVPLRVGS